MHDLPEGAADWNDGLDDALGKCRDTPLNYLTKILELLKELKLDEQFELAASAARLISDVIDFCNNPIKRWGLRRADDAPNGLIGIGVRRSIAAKLPEGLRDDRLVRGIVSLARAALDLAHPD